MAEALLDNDVLHKAARYGLIRQLLNSVPLGIDGYHMLGAAKFILLKKLKRRPPARGAEAAIAQFHAETACIDALEPSPDEVAYSAELELLAQRINVPLDVGESMLCAILTLRSYAYLLTGDKRAIGALEVLLASMPTLHVTNKLVCLEQLFFWLTHDIGIDEVRTAVCAEFIVDKTLSSCYACHAPKTTLDECCAGLLSYIECLRRTAPTVLIVDP